MSTNYSVLTREDLEAHIALGLPVTVGHLQRALDLDSARMEARIASLEEELEEERDQRRSAASENEEAEKRAEDLEEELKAEQGRELYGWIWHQRTDGEWSWRMEGQAVDGGEIRRLHAAQSMSVDGIRLDKGAVYWAWTAPGVSEPRSSGSASRAAGRVREHYALRQRELRGTR